MAAPPALHPRRPAGDDAPVSGHPSPEPGQHHGCRPRRTPFSRRHRLLLQCLPAPPRPDRAFPDPARFDPDRWTSPADPAARRAYIPFGAGKRKCIGDTFALTEATIILSAIASRWHLTPATGSSVHPQLHGTLTPAGLRLVTQARATLLADSSA
ncbi:cytochrome P450 [Streptomyces sp. NPDC055287]